MSSIYPSDYEGDVEGIGIQQLRRQGPHFFDAMEPAPELGDAIFGQIGGPFGHRTLRGTRQGSDGSVIEKGPPLGHRELRSPFRRSRRVHRILPELWARGSPASASSKGVE